MKLGIISFILFLLYILSSKADPCKIFACGVIDHKYEVESNRTCVFVPKDTKATVPAEPCGSKTYDYCPGNDWIAPDNAKSGVSYVCTQNDPTPPLYDVSPGDYCLNSTYCYAKDYGAKCENGKCVAAKKLGENCITDNFPDNQKCPENSYCSNDSKTCVPALKEGDDCSDYYKYCGYGLDCFGSADGKTYKCAKLFQAAVGTQFKFDRVKGTNEIIGAKSFCSSYNSYGLDISTKECRPYDQSVDDTEEKLRRDEPGAFCYYKTWSDQKSTYNSSVEKADVSYCGFNVDNYSWCNKRKGDPYYKNLFDKLKSIDLSKYTCHVSSNWRSCKSFADNNKDLFVALDKWYFETTDGFFPLIANNDKCVKNAINAEYWTIESSSFGQTILPTLVIIAGSLLLVSL